MVKTSRPVRSLRGSGLEPAVNRQGWVTRSYICSASTNWTGRVRPLAYKALQYLAEHRGRLISKDQLVEEVWEGRAVTNDSLVKCLRDVRQALGEGGYIFDLGTDEKEDDQRLSSEQIDVLRVVVEDEETEVETTARGESPPDVSAKRSGFEWRRDWRRVALATATLLAISLTGIFAYRSLTGRLSGPARIESIAVLPFKNESGTQDIDYRSDGISESLISKLSQLPGLKVIARSSAFKYKALAMSPNRGETHNILGLVYAQMGRFDEAIAELQKGRELGGVDGRGSLGHVFAI